MTFSTAAMNLGMFLENAVLIRSDVLSLGIFMTCLNLLSNRILALNLTLQLFFFFFFISFHNSFEMQTFSVAKSAIKELV